MCNSDSLENLIEQISSLIEVHALDAENRKQKAKPAVLAVQLAVSLEKRKHELKEECGDCFEQVWEVFQSELLEEVELLGGRGGTDTSVQFARNLHCRLEGIKDWLCSKSVQRDH